MDGDYSLKNALCSKLHPRLSSSLRAHGGVSKVSHIEHDRIEIDTQALQLKKQAQLASLSTQRSWYNLKEAIVLSCCPSDRKKVYKELEEFRLLACEFVSGEPLSDVTDDLAVSLFSILKKSDKVGRSEGTRLRSLVGPFPANVATKLCQLLQRIRPLCDGGPFEEEEILSGSTEPKEFGSNVTFHFSDDTSPKIRDDSHVYDSLSEGEEDLTSHLVKLTDNAMFPRAIRESPQPDDVPVQQWESPSAYDANWLVEMCKICAGDREWRDVMMSIFDILSSPNESSAIEGELLDVVGLEHFEVVQLMLNNRELLVISTLESSALFTATDESVEVYRSRKTNDRKAANGPTFGSQIFVESQQERNLRKQWRKEEKKMEKREKDLLTTPAFDSEINIEHYRRERERSLQEAANKPLFKGQRLTQASREYYPYVFDTMATVKQSAATVGGKKVVLPEKTQVTSKLKYEEIHVPPEAANAPLPDLGINKLNISTLDVQAQKAFQGTKSLNLIQSIVYETAYKTNENLLICAPTGAGKTNIAMLTVLRELKLHITDDGTIKKNEFKIIYVAPMKALASEMVQNFGRRLSALGILVRELTGDMQLTKSEIQATQMIVTTPEKWDVVTRKGTGDVALSQLVRLLIVDEVHLLHEDRGAVIESIIARTLRQVESTQNMIRIVGLSATLPNYLDVAQFLRVNPVKGLFFFDGRFRPVPLAQTFVGVKKMAGSKLQQLKDMDEVCYEKVLEAARRGHQVLVFVHARNATMRTAVALRDEAVANGDASFFEAEQNADFGKVKQQVERSRNKTVRDLFSFGFSVHHAGMLRNDRHLVERCFAQGHIRVLVCTATLAWGVNLPAVRVVIKGTQIYNAEKGSFVDLGILDVMQIFGRAGRPQYHREGEGIIITTHDKLAHYLSIMTRQNPIESQFVANLEDNLNAEIALGTVVDVEEAVKWLSYTYLFVRMRQNPQAYGLKYNIRESDPALEEYRRSLITAAANQLQKAKMIRFVEQTTPQGLFATDLGRTASHFYIKHRSIETFNEHFRQIMIDDDLLALVSQSQEFDQIKVREDEMIELEDHLNLNCKLPVRAGKENSTGKVNILLQTYISRGLTDTFSLVSDMAFVAQNSSRILRGLFEISLHKGWPSVAAKLLTFSNAVDQRLWPTEHPLKQFSTLSQTVLDKIEDTKLSIDRLRDMQPNEIGHLLRHVKIGKDVKDCVLAFPTINLECSMQPITRTVLRVKLTIEPNFKWTSHYHGNTAMGWWIWVEDPDHDTIYHSEYFLLQKKHVLTCTAQELVFAIPLTEPLPNQYYVRAMSDRWLRAETVTAISFKHLILPELHPPHTNLLDLQPLPVTALKNFKYKSIYSFDYFNPIQTQVFHTLYHTNHNVLLGAPTGSGKTVAAELAIFRVFKEYPGSKCVYIAPLKALVRERIEDWKQKIELKIGKKVVELTGDVSPDIRAIEKADIIVTTPEKWDSISRSWQNRTYVQAVALLVIDEIHMLGEDRGPVLEVIVSRTNFISSHTEQKVRVVGLSTALANARDLADWLGISQAGLFNFRPAVRPVPLDVHISGFPTKQYCPRMATMNKPAFTAIATHSPNKPTLIFVASRRQTRLTAQALIGFLATTEHPKQWLHLPETKLEQLLLQVKETNLKFTLGFGIGIHHAGLQEKDRKLVEELFYHQKIQVLVATSTLAWGVNLPAHLVIVKGTEYYDGKTQHYVDYPITDVLQMMGRAGRPQFDDKGVAVIFVQDTKKHFYKKFLYEPFPVESSLFEVLSNHLNAEIVAGTITSKQDAIDYMTWTYFFRRLLRNPSYYHLEEAKHDLINVYLSQLIEKNLNELEASCCIQVDDDDRTVSPGPLGCIASFYYLHHLTVRMFSEKIQPNSSLEELLQLLCDVTEYNELPVRHNEDNMNSVLAQHVPLPVDPGTFDSPHTKAHLLFQVHFSRGALPIVDYYTDTKTVLDQAIRILQAMIDVAANEGWLTTVLRTSLLLQMVIQGRWGTDSTLLTLPHLDKSHLSAIMVGFVKWKKLYKNVPLESVTGLPELVAVEQRDKTFLKTVLGKLLGPKELDELKKVLFRLPIITVKHTLLSEDNKELVYRSVAGRDGKLYTRLEPDRDYVLKVELTRNTLRGSKEATSTVYAPQFTKPKDEGWFIILGNSDNNDLVALKRIGFIRSKTVVTLSVTTPSLPGRHSYTLFIISDSYLGLDQQYDISVTNVD